MAVPAILQPSEKAARFMEHLADHNAHGYSQPHRYGDGWTEEVDLGDGLPVTMHHDYDCSWAVIQAYASQGVDTGEATYTLDLYLLLDTGNFKSVPIDQAKRGDILNSTKNRHAVMYLGDGKIAEAHHGDYAGGIDGRAGDQDGTEIRVRSYYDGGWTACYRCIRKREVLPTEGWYEDAEGNWFYFREGQPIRNKWHQHKNGDWYYFDAEGHMVTGYSQAGTKDWYVFDTVAGHRGVMLHDCPVRHMSSDAWCWLGHNGKVVKDAKLTIGKDGLIQSL